jgi:hypothetical protein
MIILTLQKPVLDLRMSNKSFVLNLIFIFKMTTLFSVSGATKHANYQSDFAEYYRRDFALQSIPENRSHCSALSQAACFEENFL